MTKSKQIAFLSGKITGDPNYKEKFAQYQKKYEELGYIVINPCSFNEELPYNVLMALTSTAVAESDVIVTLPDWADSNGAMREWGLALSINYGMVAGVNKQIQIIYEEEL